VNQSSKGALEVLEEIRKDEYPDLSAALLAAVFALETDTQFDVDRAPVIAKLRDLIRGSSQG
jgi:hypothetical protein